MCVAEDCGSFPPTFVSSEAWKRHMCESHGTQWYRSVHRTRWKCLDCAKSFLTQDLLGRHLVEHQEGPRRANELEIVEIPTDSQITQLRPAGQCPLCAANAPWYDPWKAASPGAPMIQLWFLPIREPAQRQISTDTSRDISGISPSTLYTGGSPMSAWRLARKMAPNHPTGQDSIRKSTVLREKHLAGSTIEPWQNSRAHVL